MLISFLCRTSHGRTFDKPHIVKCPMPLQHHGYHVKRIPPQAAACEQAQFHPVTEKAGTRRHMQPSRVSLGALKDAHGATPFTGSIPADKTREGVPPSLSDGFPAVSSYAERRLELPG